MRRIDDGTMMAHADECGFLTSLIIDLKKRELGREHAAITMDRLNEASKVIGKIQSCRKKVLFR